MMRAVWCGAVAGFVVQAGAAPLPLEVAPDGRTLRSVDGGPFVWVADTAWNLYRLEPDEVVHYLDDRRDKGFTVIQGPVLLGDDENHAGHVNDDPAAVNESWLAHIDFIIAAAAERDLRVAPVLAWGTHADRFDARSAQAYGALIGSRYQTHDNIAAFIIAGEHNYPGDNDTAIWDSLALGVYAGSNGRHPITIHPRWFGGMEGQTSSHDFHDAPWLTFNMIQSAQYGDCTNDPRSHRYAGAHNWLLVDHDRGNQPSKPTLDAEPTYEMINPPGPPTCDAWQDRWDDYGVRRRAYWSVLAGGFGVSYGANGVFQFNQADAPVNAWAPLHTWDVAIDYPGAAQMGHLRRLLESRPMPQRDPAQQIILSSNTDDVPDHVRAAIDACGRYAMIFVPTAATSVHVDLSWRGGAAVRAWWFDPRDGETTFIEVTSADDATYTTPGYGPDWVLVLDDAGQGYPPPGTDVAYQPPNLDLTADGAVDIDDLLTLILSWGAGPDAIANIDGDCTVGRGDLGVLLWGWGG